MSLELKKARQGLREAIEQINKALEGAVDAARSAGVSERYISDVLRNQMQHRAKPLPYKQKSPEELWRLWRTYSPEERERWRQEAKQKNERLLEVERERMEERDAEARLSLEMINAGYRTLAAKYHPDKGGSRDVFVRLNRGRDRLTSNV